MLKQPEIEAQHEMVRKYPRIRFECAMAEPLLYCQCHQIDISPYSSDIVSWLNIKSSMMGK